jgi:hypothetical protein
MIVVVHDCVCQAGRVYVLKVVAGAELRGSCGG